MIYYTIMTGISLASFTRMLLALDSAGKNYVTHPVWDDRNKPEMRIIPLDPVPAARAEYIDRIAERVDIGRNWIKKVEV